MFVSDQPESLPAAVVKPACTTVSAKSGYTNLPAVVLGPGRLKKKHRCLPLRVARQFWLIHLEAFHLDMVTDLWLIQNHSWFVDATHAS